MSEKPISPLRRRMIEDMTVRNFVDKTHNDYIRHVRTFAAFLGRSPDTATAEDLRRFQLHQVQTGVRPPSINGAVAALRFFFGVTLDRPDMGRPQGALTVGLQGVPLPKFAPEIGCTTWAQLLLKFIVSHPAVTTAIPATTRVDHVVENMAAASGPLPDEGMRATIVAAVKSV